MDIRDIIRQMIDTSQIISDEVKIIFEKILASDEDISEETLEIVKVFLDIEIEFDEMMIESLDQEIKNEEQKLSNAQYSHIDKSNEIRKKLPQHLDEIANKAITELKEIEAKYYSEVEDAAHDAELSEADAIRAQLQSKPTA